MIHFRLSLPAAVAVSLLAAFSFFAAAASASPAPMLDNGDVIYRRSCSECAEASFCEYGYPKGPKDSVACVSYNAAAGPRALYRRYTSPTNGACPNSDILGAYPTSKLCDGGAAQYTACHMGTGHPTATGSTTTSGVCYTTSGATCCVPSLLLEPLVCQQVYKLCISGGEAVLVTAETAGKTVYCEAATGAVTGTTSGAYKCSNSGPASTAGSFAGCCVAT
ncbi:hypothetical protein DFJ74DRAFT_652719 [Hyaloraphidium curvatum]|nr:hypothetical protein DFJ74DRAFT_652719 [Hyaloraphidium curvatum]